MTRIMAALCRRTLFVLAASSGVLLLASGAPAAPFAGQPHRPASAAPRHVPGEILIEFRADASASEVNAILRDLGAVKQRPFRRTRAEHHTIKRSVEDAVARYTGHRAVRFIEPNYVLTAANVPNDPSFPTQWSLRNTGQQGGTPGADVDAVAAWDRTTGSSSVLIAIIDSGMQLDHPDLAPNLDTNAGEIAANGQDDDGNGWVDDVHGYDFANMDPDPSDDYGHGTHVSGIVGAAGNNGIGIAGVAWQVRLLPLKFLDANGSGTTSGAVHAIQYAVARGATAINASWGGGGFSEALLAAIQAANDAGVLFVAAAGNLGVNNDEFAHFPSNFDVPNIVAVGSSNRVDARSDFSSYGSLSVDLFAPGSQILSTLLEGSYGLANGTSMAAPHVTGAVALLSARFPGIAASTMKAILIGATDRVPALDGLAVGGRLNLARLMDGVDSIPPSPVVDLALDAASSDRLTMRWTATGDDGATGTATRYDIRVSTRPIDESTFGILARVTGLPAPRTAGSAEQGVVRLLSPSTDYYVALKVVDDFGNSSPLSNVVAARTTAPPVVAVSRTSLDGELPTGVRGTIPLAVRNDGAGTLDFTVSVHGTTGGPVPPWLSVSPLSGSAAVGQPVGLTVTLNAAGLGGGTYAARLRIQSNDPERGVLDVPVTLRVVPAPDIDVYPSPLAFGALPIGVEDTQGLLVTNVGFELLNVGLVEVSGAAFRADPSSFTLGPGDSWEIPVSVTVPQAGPFTGVLTLHSDDPDEPVVTVFLEASGRVPPTATITPAAIVDSLHTGQTGTQTITVTNSGGSSLFYGLRVQAARALPREPAAGTAPAALSREPAAGVPSYLSDVRIAFDARGGTSSGPWGAFMGSLASRGALVTANPDPISHEILDGVDVYWLTDGSPSLGSAELDALSAWVRRGGSLLLEGEAPAALATFNAALSSVDVPIRYEALPGTTGPTDRLVPFEITRGVAAAHWIGTAARLSLTGSGAWVVIEDASGTPAMAASFAGRGRVLAVTARQFADIAAILADNRRIASQSMDWLGGAVWLSTSPEFGTVPVGRSVSVTARLDAGMLAGAVHRAVLVVDTDDPALPRTLLPVDLTVRPAPDVDVAEFPFDIGRVFVGATGIVPVPVRNVGVLPLHVHSVAVDRLDFSAPADSFTLAPGASRPIVVSFTPGSSGPASASLRLTTDDPDEPEVRATVTATGAPPPDIDVQPAAVAADLPAGSSTTRPLFVSNRSGSDLEFSVRFVENEAAAASRASAEAAAPPERLPSVPSTWAGRREEALAAGDVRASMAEATGRAIQALGGGGRSLAGASVDTLPLVVIDPRADGGVSDLLLLRGSGRAGLLSVELTTSTEIVPRNFGGFLSLDLDQNPNTGREPSFGSPRQDVGMELEVSFFSLLFGYIDLYDGRTGAFLKSFPAEADAHSVRFAIPLSDLQNDDGRMNVSGVIGNFSGATDWFPDRGHGTVGGLWLAASPSSGRLAAGGEQTLTLRLDARGLRPGSYSGAVLVHSNDPDERTTEVEASLTVRDAPLLNVSALPVSFGSIFVGHAADAELIVGNTGTAPLVVTGVSTDAPDVAVGPSAFTVAPGRTQAIALQYAPVAAGPLRATLTIAAQGVEAAAVPLSGDALDPPVISVQPPELSATVALGDSGTDALRVENRGGSPLRIGIESVAGSVTAASHESIELPRDQEDARRGDFGALGTGGPDLFGYRWADSDQAGGPIFDWVEIRDIGTSIPIRELDQNSGPLPIGFAFPFYGRTYTSFHVCTHGWISLTNGGVAFQNQPLPTTGAPENLLAVFWDDLNFGGAERAAYHYDGTRLIVQFTRVPRRAAGGPFTFQAILYPTGAIVYQYLEVAPPTSSATIGIQNATRSDGLTVAFNELHVRDRMAIRLWAAPEWLRASPLFATLPPGAGEILEVKTDARRLFAGTYRGSVRIGSNDPLRRETLVPVTLRARGVPDLAFSPETLLFDTLTVGESARVALRVTNLGTDRLEVTSIAADRPDFRASPASLSLAPLQSAEALVHFTPRAAGDRGATLTLTSDDPGGPHSVPIAAFAVLPHRELTAEVTPSTIQRGSRGRLVRAKVPFPADLDAARVDLGAVRLQDVIPPDLGASRVRDLDGDSRLDLDLAFDRGSLERALPQAPGPVPVRVTGEVAGAASFAARDTIRVTGSGSAGPGLEVVSERPPAASGLHANSPNPFAGGTRIRFDLALPARAALRIYAPSGRLVRTLAAGAMPAGAYAAWWDGRDDRRVPAASGVYFARLELPEGPQPRSQLTRRMLLMKR